VNPVTADLIPFSQALALTLEHVAGLAPVELPLAEAADLVAAADLSARADSPSADASLRDGYAVRSQEVRGATPGNPVRLRLAGTAAAGGGDDLTVAPGTAVRILTGARIPAGADAVVSEEFTRRQNGAVLVGNHAEAGRNILRRGSDVAAGDRLCAAGEVLTPGRLGLLAAGGLERVAVVPAPRVAVVATGDEVLLPGAPLRAGALYASNLLMLQAWCRRAGMSVAIAAVGDDEGRLEAVLRRSLAGADALITSGGAWRGDRDRVATALAHLGWRCIYHHLRLGPGKAAGFGLLGTQPVFVLPGGPPANLAGFLLLVLPALQRLAGRNAPPLPEIRARLACDLPTPAEWTQPVFGRLAREGDKPRFEPLTTGSRLRCLAEADALLVIPEGTAGWPRDASVTVQVLR